MKNRGKWTVSKPREINGETYYSCIKKIGATSTYIFSAYKYECELCVHSIDTMGRPAYDYSENEFMPRMLYCPYQECPYKAQFREREIQKQKMIEKMKQEATKDLLKENANELRK